MEVPHKEPANFPVCLNPPENENAAETLQEISRREAGFIIGAGLTIDGAATGRSMKYTKTYAGAAVFHERLADDGWPEDAGRWPERCGSQIHSVACPNESMPASEGKLSSLFIEPFLRNRKRA